MRFTLSNLAIGAAAVTSVLFAAAAVYLVVFVSDDNTIPWALLERQQQQLDRGTAASRTVQVYLLGGGRLSCSDEEMTLDAFATRVEREGWNEHTNVQLMVTAQSDGTDTVRLLGLLARQGVFHVRILPASAARDAQP